jgi:geranylgeranyl reductase family protein
VSTDVDVAIVGGGPAGAAAAQFLASRGRSVLVCERKQFPREKTCGDGLTPRAIKMLEIMGLGEELSSWERVGGLRAHGGGRTLDLPFPPLDDWCDYGLVKPRRDLDTLVLERAEVAGAKVLFGTEVKRPVLRDDGVCTGFVARRDGLDEEVRAHWIVCAEGAATKTTRALGKTRNLSYPLGLAIRQYFRSPLEHSGWFDAFLDLRSADDALPGYGWVFPVGDGTVNAGVGLLSTFDRWREVNLHVLQDSFLRSLPPEWEIRPDTACSRPRAGRLFMGGSVWPPHGPGFVVAGDAAGMVNPCNGEGIAYGYETGYMAARHIDVALQDGSSPDLDDYSADLKSTYGPYFRLGRRFVKTIGNPELMERLVSFGMRSRAVMSFLLTLLANLEDRRMHGREQVALKLLKRLAEVRS